MLDPRLSDRTPDRVGARRPRPGLAGMHGLGCALALASCLASVPAAAAQPAVSVLDGPAYEGDFRLTIRLPDGKSGVERGEASVRLEPKADGKSDFVLQSGAADGRTRGDMRVAGAHADGGWRSVPGDVTLTVSPDGSITGGGREASLGMKLTFDGNATDTRVRLRNQVTIEKPQGGAPAGTVLDYTYDLRRAATTAASAEDAKTEGGCRMRMVPIANFGGGMTMGMVPDCDGD